MAGNNVGHHGSVEALKRYWAEGPGAAQIGWGTGGDHTRCVRLIQEEIVEHGGKPLPDHEIHGLCTNLEQRATGRSGGGGGNHGHGR